MAKKAKRGRPVSEDISEAQRKALAGIRDFTNRKGYPPTMAELGEMLEITAASVHQLINQLERKGYVKREARKARSLAVTREARREPERLVAIPLLGKVKGGPAMLSDDSPSVRHLLLRSFPVLIAHNGVTRERRLTW